MSAIVNPAIIVRVQLNTLRDRKIHISPVRDRSIRFIYVSFATGILALLVILENGINLKHTKTVLTVFNPFGSQHSPNGLKRKGFGEEKYLGVFTILMLSLAEPTKTFHGKLNI